MMDHSTKTYCRGLLKKEKKKSEVGVCGFTHTLMSLGTVLKSDAFHLPRQWIHEQIYHNENVILITE